VAETEWLLECAAASEEICGVVGWVPLMDAGLPTILDRLASRPKLVGIREIVQGQAAGFMDQPAFQSGVGLLSNYGLAYDLLLHEGQLVEATRLVDRYPNQRFVLDHAAKPRIAAGEIEPWGGALRELARRENVVCKLSGLVTEAVWKDWSLETLRPYLDVCVQSFGANRLLAGTDWPVCLLASSYVGWWGVLAEYFSAFSGAEKQGIFGANTLAAYRVAS
jgi:L-fuconolactonase